MSGSRSTAGRTSGTGVTLAMKQIRNTVPQEVLSENRGANRETRRHEQRRHGKFLPSINPPYINPARDLRKGRRLR